MRGLLRTQGVGSASGNGLGSPQDITWNILGPFFAFQDHAERYHDRRLG